jgi:phosphoglycerate dehydrogenase-like enzyme
VSERPAPVLIVSGTDGDDPPPGIQQIAELVDLRYAPDRDSLVERIPDAEILYSWWGRREDLEAAWAYAVNLRWIQASNVGVQSILFPALVESDVIVTNARGAVEQPIAESVVGFIVAMAKDFPTMMSNQRGRSWGQPDTERIADRQLLIVGPGPIGREIAKACKHGLAMRCEAVGRSSRPGDGVFDRILGPEAFHDALSRADYVVNAMPGTPATAGMFDVAAFASMKPSARFINVGRGSTVDETALVDAIRRGGIAGAALDVFEEEPLPVSSPLWDLPGVIVCPHMSGNVEGWQAGFASVFYDNLSRWIRKEPLANVVDKRLGFPAGS